MASITRFAQPMAMATTQLACVIHYQDARTCPFAGDAERKS
jgi:hypothetical protein